MKEPEDGQDPSITYKGELTYGSYPPSLTDLCITDRVRGRRCVGVRGLRVECYAIVPCPECLKTVEDFPWNEEGVIDTSRALWVERREAERITRFHTIPCDVCTKTFVLDVLWPEDEVLPQHDLTAQALEHRRQMSIAIARANGS